MREPEKQPVEMLLKILINGGRVKDGGCEYAMDEYGSLALVCRTENGREHAIRVDCDLPSFKAMADSIGKDELWLKCCELQLKK